MKDSIKEFILKVEKMNPNEPEFMQAVTEVAEAIIPFIEDNEMYQDKMLLERMVEPEQVVMFRVPSSFQRSFPKGGALRLLGHVVAEPAEPLGEKC